MLAEASATDSLVESMAAGRFADALLHLRPADATAERSPDLLLNLAIAEDRNGDRQNAQGLMEQLALENPQWDEPVLRLAESLRSTGNLVGAEAVYRRALARNPARPEAIIALSGILLLLGRPSEAQSLLLPFCHSQPDRSEAWDMMGMVHAAAGNTISAISAFVAAQRLRPDCVDYVLHGVDAAMSGAVGEAELTRLTVCCEENPFNAVAHLGRGALLDRLGRQSEAVDALAFAAALAPNATMPLRFLGSALARTGEVWRAEQILRRIWRMDPDDPEICNSLATVLMRQHRHAEARRMLLDLIDQYDSNVSALCNLANATACVGLQDEAVIIANRAIDLDPEALLPRRALCNTLPYQYGVAGNNVLAAMRDCGRLLPRTAPSALLNEPDADRPLVIGLLSGSLRSHPVGWLTVAGLECLDPAQFTIVCLTQNVAADDVITRRYRAIARQWIDVGSLSDAALSETARQHGIDVLIELGGYGDSGRMPACANRLAPVQIKWVGMQAHCSGIEEMDWYLTDRWETPEGFEPLYNEKLLRMPDGYVCYSPPSNAPAVAELPAVANGYVTFGCFNNIAKVTPETMQAWASILRQIPNSRLIMKTHQLTDQTTTAGLLADFSMLGISSTRIELRGSSVHRAFMGEYNDIDIALDPFPYSGGLTTCEALWMGVPTITLPGETFASRHSASHLSNAGLADWITESTSDYIRAAVRRASELDTLVELRAGMRNRVRKSPLCDAPRFGHNLGSAIRRAWREWCSQQTV